MLYVAIILGVIVITFFLYCKFINKIYFFPRFPQELINKRHEFNFIFESCGVEYSYEYKYAAGSTDMVKINYEVMGHSVCIYQEPFCRILIDNTKCKRKQKKEILKSLKHIPPIIDAKVKELKEAKYQKDNSKQIALDKMVDAITFKAVRNATEEEMAIHLSSAEKAERIYAENLIKKK